MTIDLFPAIRTARRFHLIFTIGLITVAVIAASLIAATLFAPAATGAALVGFAGIGSYSVTGLQAAVIVALMLVWAALWAAVFALGRELCANLSQSSIEEASKAAAHLSHVLLALLVWSIVGQAVTSAAITWHLGDGQRMVKIALGMPQISLALAALMGVFLARAFSVGAELWRDHTEIV